MQTNTLAQNVGQQVKNPVAKPQIKIPINERMAYTLPEFAALFSHERSWAYRQVYCGRVRTISDMGQLLIPREEVERLMNHASIYERSKKLSKNKNDLADRVKEGKAHEC